MTEWGVHPEYAGRKEVIHRIGEERRWRFFHQFAFVPNSDRHQTQTCNFQFLLDLDRGGQTTFGNDVSLNQNRFCPCLHCLFLPCHRGKFECHCRD